MEMGVLDHDDFRGSVYDRFGYIHARDIRTCPPAKEGMSTARDHHSLLTYVVTH